YEIESLRNSNIDLVLLSTIVQDKGESKAIIKYSLTSKLKSFKLGDEIDLIEGYKFKILQILPCLVVIDVNGSIEKIECNKRLDYQAASYYQDTLSGYKIIPPRFLFLKNKYSNEFDKEILSACTKFDVDPNLVKALIKAESNFNQYAVSNKNAEGLMQLMDGTARDYGVENTFNPKSNIEGGVRFLKDLLNYFNNDLSLSIAAYNAGKQTVINYGNSIPPYPETQQFVKRVLSYYRELTVN
ncbi:MAG: transglycosylase SLT domain-containing protein, partial [Candidatus Dadabacteria bacterium]|nr:transglycosylase SLT domain-containing protein [Candidatus Dadabacteria bacterium]NIQ15253.1 transglycosylase SLT domain-containing protein [Candidatus Dadabacteria bacterium]